MASVATYLNFDGKTEEAFEFYKSVFGTEYAYPIMRFKDIPADPSQPAMAEGLKDMIMNVALPITGGHILMGTDAPKEMGFDVIFGNSVHISLMPDSRTEAERLFNALSAGGEVSMALGEQFWGDYFGSWTDKYGICWMVNTSAKS